MEKQTITEESEIHKEWAKEVAEMTMEKLLEFIRKLTNDYNHDYGTVCHAVACAAIAAAKAVMRTDACNGITGFQAGAIQWEIIKLWGLYPEGSNLRMIDYNDLLYPQYWYKFKAIKPSVWEETKKKAKKLLAVENYGSELVRKHWQSIVNDVVPFGLLVEES